MIGQVCLWYIGCVLFWHNRSIVDICQVYIWNISIWCIDTSIPILFRLYWNYYWQILFKIALEQLCNMKYVFDRFSNNAETAVLLSFCTVIWIWQTLYRVTMVYGERTLSAVRRVLKWITPVVQRLGREPVTTHLLSTQLTSPVWELTHKLWIVTLIAVLVIIELLLMVIIDTLGLFTCNVQKL